MDELFNVCTDDSGVKALYKGGWRHVKIKMENPEQVIWGY